MSQRCIPNPVLGPRTGAAQPNRHLASILSFRTFYRVHAVPKSYSGAVHFATLIAACIAIGWGSMAQLDQLRTFDWLTIPVTLLIANFVEYHAHRGPMHHRVTGLGLIYMRHVRQHHRFFRSHAMETEEPRDLRVVLFPMALLLFFFGLIALPVGVIVLWVFGHNIAMFYGAAVAAYYLGYECLHYTYHAPWCHWSKKFRLIRWLGENHQRHHDPRRMNQCNFNLTFPLWDWVYGTGRYSDAQQ
ncbi:MAG: hypothetical protein ACI9W2_000834 [Gammaproteobacteria bacterium]|jgi:hypothetical protein